MWDPDPGPPAWGVQVEGDGGTAHGDAGEVGPDADDGEEGADEDEESEECVEAAVVRGDKEEAARRMRSRCSTSRRHAAHCSRWREIRSRAAGERASST